MLLVGADSSTLSMRRPVSLQALATYPLILPAPPHSARFLVESALATIGHKPILAIEADIAPLAYFVTRGLGLSVVPTCAASNLRMVGAGMKMAPIRGMSISWVVARPLAAPPSLATALLERSIFELAKALIDRRQWRATLLGPVNAMGGGA